MVCNILSHAQEFRWVRFLLCQWSTEKWFVTTGVMHRSLGGLDSPLTNIHERSDLQHLYSCTRILGEQASPLPMVRREVVCNMWSEASLGW